MFLKLKIIKNYNFRFAVQKNRSQCKKVQGIRTPFRNSAFKKFTWNLISIPFFDES